MIFCKILYLIKGSIMASHVSVHFELWSLYPHMVQQCVDSHTNTHTYTQVASPPSRGASEDTPLVLKEILEFLSNYFYRG